MVDFLVNDDVARRPEGVAQRGDIVAGRICNQEEDMQRAHHRKLSSTGQHREGPAVAQRRSRSAAGSGLA